MKYDDQGRLMINMGVAISDAIADADADTYVRVEQAADEDIIRFGTAGVERAYIDGDNVYITEYLRHHADADNYLRFTDDRLRVVVGGVDILDITEAGADTVVWNEGGIDVDFRWEGIGELNALFIQGSDGFIGIHTNAPDYELDVAGNIGLDEYIYHNADVDTYVRFTDDRFRIVVGSLDILDIIEAATDTIVFNEGGVDIDFRVEGSGAPNALFVQGSDGRVGIGTAVIPHGGVGNAMLAIEGANVSWSLGPHVQFTTTNDDYPLLMLRPLVHDNVGIMFDSYNDGTNDVSSDAGSNFFILKQGDTWQVRYDSGIAQGAAITWNYGIVLTAIGKVGIDTSTIPHGAIGYAMLALDGANASANGPHVQITTVSDDYPVLQLRNWQHDGVYIYIDSYYDGADRSSDAGSNFRISKGATADILQIEYDSGIAAGGAVTFNPGITLDPSGNVGIGSVVHGANAVTTLFMPNTATEPAASANLVHIYCLDRAVDNAQFCCYQESAVVADADETKFSNKWPVRINGVDYFIMMTTT